MENGSSDNVVKDAEIKKCFPEKRRMIKGKQNLAEEITTSSPGNEKETSVNTSTQTSSTEDIEVMALEAISSTKRDNTQSSTLSEVYCENDKHSGEEGIISMEGKYSCSILYLHIFYLFIYLTIKKCIYKS